MRSKKRFSASARPKRTHAERRIALVPHHQRYLLETLTVNGESVYTNIAASDDHKYGPKRASFRPWMKRSEYVRAYGGGSRHGKWVARQWRGMEKRYARRMKNERGVAGEYEATVLRMQYLKTLHSDTPFWWMCPNNGKCRLRGCIYEHILGG